MVMGKQAVATFPVGVICCNIKNCDSTQFVVKVISRLVNGEVMLRVICIDKPLNRADSQRAITDDGRRDGADAKRLAHEVGSTFSSVEAGLKIPERTLAANRLVDRSVFTIDRAHEHGKRCIRAPWHPTFDFEVGRHENFNAV